MAHQPRIQAAFTGVFDRLCRPFTQRDRHRASIRTRAAALHLQRPTTTAIADILRPQSPLRDATATPNRARFSGHDERKTPRHDHAYTRRKFPLLELAFRCCRICPITTGANLIWRSTTAKTAATCLAKPAHPLDISPLKTAQAVARLPSQPCAGIWLGCKPFGLTTISTVRVCPTPCAY